MHRFLLTLGTLAVCAKGYALMLRGWRSRLRRQSDLPDGVHLLRDGLPEVFVPMDDLRAVSVEKALAGKIVSTGMLVLTWYLGDRELATAFRADDPAAHARLRDALLEVAA